MNDAEIKLKVSVDEAGASKKIQTLGQKADQVASKFKNAGKALTVGLTLPIVGAGVASVKFASDLEETMNKVDVSFGENAKRVKDWAKTSIKSMGLAQQSALDSAALFGDMGTGMGITEEAAADMAMELTQLSADLASFKNVRQDVASTALKGIFTGETESLKSLGIVMTETNLEEFRRAKGIKKTMREMSQAEKVQLRYQFIMDKTTKAQGDFSRTSDGMANQSRMAGEQLKELSTQMGVILLPIALKLIKGLSDIVSWFSNLTEGQKKTVIAVLAFAAAIGPVISLVGSLITVVNGLVIALGFLFANPVLLGLAAVAAGIWAINKAHDAQYEKMLKIIGLQSSGQGEGGGFGGSAGGYGSKDGKAPKKGGTGGGGGRFGAPPLATGTNYTSEGLHYLHDGEAVVPKKYNPAAGGIGTGGKMTVYIQQPSIELDGRVVSRGITPYITKTVKLGGGNV